MPITFRKLRKLLEKDHITEQEIAENIIIREKGTNGAIDKHPLGQAVAHRFFNDSSKATFESIEFICEALNYNLDDTFEFVSREEHTKIQEDYKRQQKLKKQNANSTREKKSPPKTFRFGDSFTDVKVGDYIVLGQYPYDKNGNKRGIYWIVKEIQGDKIYLISRYVIDAKPFNPIRKGTTWESSPVRTWLNGEFVQEAFEEDEKNLILLSKNEYYLKHIGYRNKKDLLGKTQDRVFLPDCDDIETYWPSDRRYNRENKPNEYVPKSSRAARVTLYAKEKFSQGEIDAYLLRDTALENKSTVWGVRLFSTDIPGEKVGYLCDFNVNSTLGLRPAMWIKKN